VRPGVHLVVIYGSVIPGTGTSGSPAVLTCRVIGTVNGLKPGCWTTHGTMLVGTAIVARSEILTPGGSAQVTVVWLCEDVVPLTVTGGAKLMGKTAGSVPVPGRFGARELEMAALRSRTSCGGGATIGGTIMGIPVVEGCTMSGNAMVEGCCVMKGSG
jgi:hypothetical protein